MLKSFSLLDATPLLLLQIYKIKTWRHWASQQPEVDCKRQRIRMEWTVHKTFAKRPQQLQLNSLQIDSRDMSTEPVDSSSFRITTDTDEDSDADVQVNLRLQPLQQLL